MDESKAGLSVRTGRARLK